MQQKQAARHTGAHQPLYFTCDDKKIGYFMTKFGTTNFVDMLAMDAAQAQRTFGVDKEDHAEMNAVFIEHLLRCRACAIQVHGKLPKAYYATT